MRRLLIALAVASCSSSATSSAPTQCRQTDRTGTYLVHYVAHAGGSCVVPSDSLVTLPDVRIADGGAPDCRTLTATWTEGDCKLSSESACDYPYGGTSHATIVSRQQTQDGSRITGVYTYSEKIYDCALCPPHSCTSTYDLTLTRQ